MTELKNKTAVITGSGGGIGRAIAGKLAAEGMNIVLFGGNDLEKLEETRKAVEKFSKCLVLPGNLTDLAFLSEKIIEDRKSTRLNSSHAT